MLTVILFCGDLQDISSKPQLFTDGASRFDVSQGMLGDCWLVAAIASVAQDKILLNKVRTQCSCHMASISGPGQDPALKS